MFDKIKCTIVEDDLVAQHVLETLIAKTEYLHLVKKFEDPQQAYTYLKTNPMDLLFLDIEMPGLSGLELIELLDSRAQVVLVTAQEKYAIEAFKYNVIDYLLKPVTSYARFLKSAEKAREIILKNHPVPKTDPEDSPLFVKVDSLLHNISLKSILWIEANGDYVKINTEKKMLMVLSTLKALEAKLPEHHFVRIHRSFIVNIKRIDNIDASNLQIGSKVIPISTNFRDNLISKINLL